MVKKLPAKQKTQVQSQGGEDPLEKEGATCSILAWKIPWTEEPGRPQSVGLREKRSDIPSLTME